MADRQPTGRSRDYQFRRIHQVSILINTTTILEKKYLQACLQYAFTHQEDGGIRKYISNLKIPLLGSTPIEITTLESDKSRLASAASERRPKCNRSNRALELAGTRKTGSELIQEEPSTRLTSTKIAWRKRAKGFHISVTPKTKQVTEREQMQANRKKGRAAILCKT